MYGKPFPDKKGAGRGRFQQKKKRKKSKHTTRRRRRKPAQRSVALQAYCVGSEPTDHVAYVQTLNGLDLPHVAYVDTACAKSVGGQANADKLVEFCKEHNWPHLVIEEREPFRFGPGKRIWSQKALIIVVVWGGVTIAIKFCIVEPDVPFLVSKFVFKRLGSVLDLDDNELRLKRLNGAVEPLYDLVTGHVGVELVKENAPVPTVQASTFQLCSDGEEVMVDNDQLRKQLSNVTVLDNRTHVVNMHIPLGNKSVSFGEPPRLDDNSSADGDVSEYSSNDVEDISSEFLIGLTNKAKPVTTRTRAAPFYNELAPGWRARARFLAPPRVGDAELQQSGMTSQDHI